MRRLTRSTALCEPVTVRPSKPLTAGAIAFLSLISISCERDRSPEIAGKVRAECLHAWNNYARYALGHDALKPLSKTPHDWYGQSLLMTPVDALDTLVLMKLETEEDKEHEIIAN